MIQMIFDSPLRKASALLSISLLTLSNPMQAADRTSVPSFPQAGNMEANTCSINLPVANVEVPPDPAFSKPYIDIDEMRTLPMPHRYVHGGFEGTDTKFSFYFPPKEKYEGRFFQYVTPFAQSENIAPSRSGEDDVISFAIQSGGYYVETNGGGKGTISEKPGAVDPTIGAYRANAAAAMFSRVVALKMYGGKRPFGYIWGGSGGAYRTIGSIENTQGVWDGAVPHVMGSPVAIPNVFTVRAYAYRVLHDKFPQIVDALEPGGSGNPLAGLNSEEAAAFNEVSRMGFPKNSWYAYKTEDLQALPVLFQGIEMADPSYWKDFWSKPGYEGTVLPDSLKNAHVHYQTTITRLLSQHEAHAAGLPSNDVQQAAKGTVDTIAEAAAERTSVLPVGVELADPPSGSLYIAEMYFKSGDANGKKLVLGWNAGKAVLFAESLQDLSSIVQKIKVGDLVEIDNANFLAVQTYHRHQDPGPEYTVWNQFRDASGKPTYPQRPMVLGPLFTRSAAGSLPTGDIHSKMIVVESAWDREAYPWQADWYRTKVSDHLKGCTENNFRLWYTDHALHAELKPQDIDHAVSYEGVLWQALRDLSAWVEKGIAPADTTGYSIVDGQLVLADKASERKGIQPVITFHVNGSDKAVISAGSQVTLTATITPPPNTGQIVDVEWDLEGNGTFEKTSNFVVAKDGSATVQITHAFNKTGTYFPVLRATSQRYGDKTTLFARIQNLARVRVVVN